MLICWFPLSLFHFFSLSFTWIIQFSLETFRFAAAAATTSTILKISKINRKKNSMQLFKCNHHSSNFHKYGNHLEMQSILLMHTRNANKIYGFYVLVELSPLVQFHLFHAFYCSTFSQIENHRMNSNWGNRRNWMDNRLDTNEWF